MYECVCVCVCVCVFVWFPYRQPPGGWSEGFSLWSVGGWVQAVGSLFGRGGVADLGEIAGRYRVHERAGQSAAEELGLHSSSDGQNLHLLLRARRQTGCWPTRRRRDAFGHPHHFSLSKLNLTGLVKREGEVGSARPICSAGSVS